MSDARGGPLRGIVVVDTADTSAALAGRFLADLGARVIKIEPPGGDPARRIPPFLGGDPERSLFFEYYHAGKESLVVRAESVEERARLRRLVAAADVWIDTTPPGEASPWSLDAAVLAAESPPLIIARVTPFGLDGPFARYRATDLVAQAAGGMVFTNGFPERPPLQGYGLQAYHAASAYALVGVLVALLERRAGGRGQTIDVSLQEATAGAVEEASAAWNAERRIETRRGTLHWSRAFRVSRCRDGHVLCCTICDWTTLREWLREGVEPEALAGAEWEELPYRRDHAEEIFAVVDRWARDRTATDVLEGAQLRRIPFAAVRPPEALLENEQLRAREFFAPVEGDAGALSFPGPPFRLAATPMRTRRAAPALGSGRWPEARSRSAQAPPGERAAGGVLRGVRVLDFTHVVAGPVATRILADYGAEVIKVERLATLDMGDRRGGLFGNLNRGKKSVILNMGDPRGVDVARRLAALADVVIDNFSARVMGNWGLDYESLRRLRPDVIAIGMSGFGKTGPQRDYVSFGPTLHALCGHTMMMREPGGEPAGWGFSHSDMCGGLNGAIAALAALHHRAATGEGQLVDLSQLESVAAYMGPVLLAMANDGFVPEPVVNRSQEAPGAPHGVYRCRGDDRWVAIAVLSDEDWRRFAAAVAEPWAAEASLASAASRLAAADALDAAVARWTSLRSPEEVTALLQSRGVAAFTVANGEDFCARDPHLQWRGYWTRLATPEGGVAVVDGVPARLSATPGAVRSPGPLHGEHTTEVLHGLLGMPAAEIDELRRARVIAGR